MKTIQLSDFAKSIELVAVRRDDGGFRRVWGWFRDGDRSITFWRHQANSGFSFKISETYSGDVPLTQIVNQKLEEHGYSEIMRGTPRWESLVQRVYAEYVDVKANDGFHVPSRLRLAV